MISAGSASKYFDFMLAVLIFEFSHLKQLIKVIIIVYF